MIWMFIFMILPLVAMCYVAWHLWVLLPLAAVWRVLIIALGAGCFSLLFMSVARRFDSLPLPVAQLCYEVGTSSLIVLLYVVMLFLVLDLGRLLHVVPRQWLYGNGVAALAMLAVIVAIFVYGNWRYNNKVRVELQLTTDKPLARDYRIVMLSDLHIGYHNTRRDLARWVDLINQEHPDLILIAGDIIDGSMRPLIEERMHEEFHRLQAPVYASLGNHEYYAGTPEAQQFYRDAGIHLLSDAHTTIDSCLVIIGRDDRTNRRRKTIKELIPKAPKAPKAPLSPPEVAPPSAPEGATIASTPGKQSNEAPSGAVGGASEALGASGYTILLDHQPYDLDKAEEAGIDFQLSGHTHRGQVWPASWVTDALYECSWGKHRRGNTRYYVSSGIGIWGGKYRIGTQSEYVVATLRRQ